MRVDKDEDCRCTVRVEVAEQVAASYISHNVLNRLEGPLDMGGVVHCEEDTGDNLNCKE